MGSKKQQRRYRAIVRQLSGLRARGWTTDTHPDIEILEEELDALGEKMTKAAKRPVIATLYAPGAI